MTMPSSVVVTVTPNARSIAAVLAIRSDSFDPTCVPSDFRTRSLRRVLDATIEAALRPGRTS
jgi:hypothetical protein